MLPVSSNKKHFLLSICYVCDMSFLFYVAILKSVSFALIYWFLIPYYVVLAVLSFIWCYCKIFFLILLFSTYLGCPHCKRIKPEFSEVAKEVNTENKVIKYSFMSTRVAHLPPNLAPMKRMKTSSTCVSEKSFCFTRSLLSVGNKHKFCSNFPCFKSESHFYPWKQSQILGKIKNKKKYAWSLYLYNWVNLGCFFLFIFYLFIFFFLGGGCVSTQILIFHDFAFQVPGALGAVDCTVDGDLCTEQEVKRYPTREFFTSRHIPVTRVFETVPNVISSSHALTNSRIYVHRPNTLF